MPQLRKPQRLRFILWILVFAMSSPLLRAQLSNTVFGKNRLQFHSSDWQYVRTDNFNVYFIDSPQYSLATYVGAVAEKELYSIQRKLGYGVKNEKIEFIFYHSYQEYLASNIGKEVLWQSSEEITPLVDGKILLFYNMNLGVLRSRIREGIAHWLISKNIVRELGGDRVLLEYQSHIPLWFVEGYIQYIGNRWTLEEDDRLRGFMNNDRYARFTSFVLHERNLASHAFWYYIDLTYGEKKVNALMTTAYLYQNINKACKEVLEKKYRTVRKEFMSSMKE